MRMAGLMVGLMGGVLGTGAVAGAAYYGWELFNAGSVEQRVVRLKKTIEEADIEVKYEKFVGDAMSPSFALENVVFTSDESQVRAERVEIKRYDWRHAETPRFSEFVIRGVRFKGDIFGSEIGQILAEAKFDQIVFDFHFGHEYVEETIDDPKARGGKRKQGRVVVKDARMEIRDLGTLAASLDLEDWHAKPRTAARLVRELPPVIRIVGERVKIKSVELRYQDSGFMNAYIDAKAAATNKRWLTARGDIVRDMQRAAREARTDVANRLYTALIRYVERHETVTGIELKFTPDAPIELRKMHAMWEANPKAFYENLKVTAQLGPTKPREERKREEPRKKP